MRFYIGVDLGQKQDHTAIVVVERSPFLLVRHVQRIALGTPYPLVVAHLREMVGRQEVRGQCGPVVDATGLGGPVVEMLRGARLGCEITAVTITGGDREQKTGGLSVSVPKRDLIAGVQVALDNGELRIARRLKELGSLVRELVDVRMTSGTGIGRVRIGADGSGEHDHRVIALALACWRAKRREIGERGRGFCEDIANMIKKCILHCYFMSSRVKPSAGHPRNTFPLLGRFDRCGVDT